MKNERTACAVFILGALFSQDASAQVDHGGRNYAPVDGEHISEDQVNIGAFTVAAGTTVVIDGAVRVQAAEIIIEGTLDATGTGPRGGFERDECSGADTLTNPAGFGPGGLGGYGDPWPTAQCSGGGGHGGLGGRAELLTSPSSGGSQLGFGGVAYGSPSDLGFDVGSGGGRPEVLCCPCETGRGGRGGGAVALYGWMSVSITGTVRVDGGSGTGRSGMNSGAGGGGSAGTILIDTQSLSFSGTLQARGGNGGVRAGGGGNGSVGGGGAGGRIKVFAGRDDFDGVVETNGGGSGVMLGGSGTFGGAMASQDLDGDGVLNSVDDCPADFFDDADGDGVCANVDPCPLDSDNDSDADGLCLADDNCPMVSNSDQANQGLRRSL